MLIPLLGYFWVKLPTHFSEDPFKLIEISSDKVLTLVDVLVEEKKQFESTSNRQNDIDLF